MKRGRKQTTGKYETRAELEERVIALCKHNSGRSVARMVDISETLVRKIKDNHEKNI